ncbi:MAG: adenylate kinase [Bacteroidales bacterium]|jgi:adenylate kinase|nr:adenylate kinase [Bacteroidales bacterium]
MVNYLIFGPPGSGKGTQSVSLAEKYNLLHLSTGDMLRAEIGSGTALGERVKGIMEKGELVPDEVVIEMIASRIDAEKLRSGFLYDGFPRTVEQAIALEKMLAGRGMKINGMLALDVEHDELVKRLMGRGAVSGRADDQDISIIENRIEVYRSKTEPLADYFRGKGVYMAVDGMGSIGDIFIRLCRAIDGSR